MFSTRCLVVFVLLNCCLKSEGFFSSWYQNRPTDIAEFLLYTKGSSSAENLNPSDVSTITDSQFVDGVKTIFLIHGFSDDGNAQWIQKMKDELLKLPESLNVIIVNWEDGADVIYLTAVDNVAKVADNTIKLIDVLVRDKNVPLSEIHMIGHSLGAQIAGHIGGLVENIGRITALDPASLGFASKTTVSRLDADDANFVDVIHTDDGALYELAFGYMPGITVGDVDFYPNGGRRQPDCPLPRFNFFRDILMGRLKHVSSAIACSHMRATAYFTSSINTCTYLSHPCPTGDDVSGAVMGYHASPTLRGKFCLQTSGKEPYCEKSAESTLERFIRYLELQ